jgi:hypothetical protein
VVQPEVANKHTHTVAHTVAHITSPTPQSSKLLSCSKAEERRGAVSGACKFK